MQDYFRFSGRLNRKPYWLRHLVIYVVMFLAFMVPALLLGGPSRVSAGSGLSVMDAILIIIFGIVLLVAMFMSIAIQVRRLHDRNKSGWWLLFFLLLPYVAQFGLAATGNPTLAMVGAAVGVVISIWYLVELGFLRGTEGPNRFGPDPLRGPVDADVFA